MNFRIYLLAIVSFVVGMAELIVGGILDIVAGGLEISLSKAGELITIYSLVFAIASPVLLTLTAKVERKKLLLVTLVLFFFGNLVAFFAPNYWVIFLSRIISAASGSLLVVLCVTIASSIVKEEFRARAIGIIFMGISGSLVLGVPIGLVIGNQFGWRSPFLFIAALTLVSMAGVYFMLNKIQPKPMVSLGEQLRTLKNSKILFAQLASALFLTGHLTLYAYLTPFLQSALNLNSTWISIFYFIFGVSAVIGGGLGGFMADKWGSKRSILTIIIVFGVALISLPKAAFSITLFVILMMIWSMLSWAISPAQQNYLIETSPETADIQQSLNNSALHLGIALGSVIGGVVINHYSVMHNAAVGGIFVFLSLLCAIYSITRGQVKSTSREAQEII
ncbi:MFS transporter [Mesobacillus foraminis]|uniref:DHA1 family purine base/nucleoside efflux pump-like MFS transporter n=1 Tax=Mesobacillus foraminis TaxID=279826 RepID=A0A4R2BEB6_9BACI|nr:MFS transporter [Mesobacillus foraminis]MBT2756737.1 MFS transporter [Mesobacillus foraminis]TCN24199.1 DHA1 family purine base/nucleoside efflux pump-like MFS transporter [Mesobacillus foraminis]